jgi:hypothetical protein
MQKELIIVENEDEQKRRFAAEMLRHPDQLFKFAMEITGRNPGKAMWIVDHWPHDPLVQQYRSEAIEEFGELHFLPGKAELARKIWEIVESSAHLIEDRLRAMRLYADVRGYIESPATVINNNNMVSNKVMFVTEFENAGAWENRVASQQAKLIEDAASTVN